MSVFGTFLLAMGLVTGISSVVYVGYSTYARSKRRKETVERLDDAEKRGDREAIRNALDELAI